MEGPATMRLLLIPLLLAPGLAAGQSLTRDIPIPRRPEPPPAVIDYNRPASVPPGVPVPPGYRDARPNLDPFLPHRSGIEGKILTPAFGRGG
jgi:hypothetical protein